MPTETPLVVVVSYNADERELYGAALESAGFCVVRLSDPNEALRVAKSQQPCVVITRIKQPGHSITGIDLTHAIKSDPATATIPVVIITSMVQREYREAATNARCDDYLLLPVLPDELLSVVKRLATQVYR